MLTIDSRNIREFCKELAKIDDSLALVYERHGTPPVWEREPTFATLIHIILEQQVSLKSALSAFTKLRDKVGEINPVNLLKLSDEELKSCYFSRQKTIYARELAHAVVTKTLQLERLHEMPDDGVRTELKKIKGIGDWTADIYLLMALRRADVMPKGDLALHIAYKKLNGLEKPPKSDEFLEIARKWRPYRAVAARLLWHFYLSEPKLRVGKSPQKS